MDSNDHTRIGNSDEPEVFTYPEGFGIDAKFPWEFVAAKKKFYTSYLIAILARTKGDVGRAAELSGIQRTNIYRMLRKIGYSRRHFYRYLRFRTPESLPDQQYSVKAVHEQKPDMPFHLTTHIDTTLPEPTQTTNNEQFGSILSELYRHLTEEGQSDSGRTDNDRRKLKLSAYIDGARIDIELPWNLKDAKWKIRGAYALAALESGRTVSEAAELIGVKPTNFYSMLRDANYSTRPTPHDTVNKTVEIVTLLDYLAQMNKP